MKGHFRVVEAMSLQTRTSAPFSAFYGDTHAEESRGRSSAREFLREHENAIDSPPRESAALPVSRAALLIQEMRNIKYSRESALHNSLPMSRNFRRVFVRPARARARAKFNLARRVKEGRWRR